ncbi:MAG: hypothetical protein HKL91_02520 [Candidatus Eremiobacteraeota bacterium]|nr:hypothetical protein [Candidatus Eremiobacteraeota bacterium]
MENIDSPQISARQQTGNAGNGERDIERVTRALNDHFSARINTTWLYIWMIFAFIATIVFDALATRVPSWCILVGSLLLWLIPTLYFAFHVAGLGVRWLCFKPFDSEILSKSITEDRALQTVFDETSFPAVEVTNYIRTSRKLVKLPPLVLAVVTILVGLLQNTAKPNLNLQGSIFLYHTGKELAGRVTGLGYPVMQAPFSDIPILLLLIALFSLLAQSVLIDATYAHTQSALETISKNKGQSTPRST